LAVHSLALAASPQPMPLHEFCPLHDDDAVLQALVPLQELMPLHFTALPAPAVSAMAPIANRSAAEATRRVRLVIGNSLQGDDGDGSTIRGDCEVSTRRPSVMA